MSNKNQVNHNEDSGLMDCIEHELFWEQDEFEVGSNVSLYFQEEEVNQYNSNMTTLGLTSIFFFTFGTAEVYGFIRSNSLCLLADSTNSVAEGILYAISFCIESYKIQIRTKKLSYGTILFSDILFPVFATIILIGFMLYIIVESLQILMNPHMDADVDMQYVLIFGSINLVMDIICISVFIHGITSSKSNLFKENITIEASEKVTNQQEIGDLTRLLEENRSQNRSPNKHETSVVREEISENNYVMLSAAINLGADLVNVIAELVAWAVSYYGHYPSHTCDAVGGLISAIIIILISLWLLFDISLAYGRLSANKRKIQEAYEKQETINDQSFSSFDSTKQTIIR